MRTVFTILFFLTGCCILFPQNNQVLFERLSLEQGLSQSIVNAILKDSKGFMWFGTQSGLNKYDGYNFVIYKNNTFDSKSISNNTILSLFEDREGIIWVGTAGGGLNKFNREKEEFKHYISDPNNPKSISGNFVVFVAEDINDNIWVFSTRTGVDYFNRESEEFIHFDHNPDDPKSLSHNTIYWLYIAEDSNVWFGTQNGLNRFNRDGGTFDRFLYTSDNGSSAIAISSIFESKDESGVLWLSTGRIQDLNAGNGLIRFNTNDESYTFYKNNPGDPNSLSSNITGNMLQTRNGDYWIATSNGLNKVDIEKGKFKNYQPNPNTTLRGSNSILGFIEDMNGMLWMKTNLVDGAYRFNSVTESFNHFKYEPFNSYSLSNDIVTVAYEDTIGVLWIGTATGGVNKVDHYAKKFTSYSYNPNNPNSLNAQIVRAIMVDRNEELWVGVTGGGLNRYNRDRDEVHHFNHDAQNPNSIASDNVWSLLENDDGSIWVGTLGGGLDKYNPETGKFIHHQFDENDITSISDNSIRELFRDKSGTLWIGTDFGGVNIFNEQNNTFSRIQNDPANPNSLPNNSVRTIIEDSQGNIWMGTLGGGLSKLALNRDDIKLEKQEVFDFGGNVLKNYQHDPADSNSISDNSVQSLHINNEGIIWIGTFGGGLNRFDPRTETFKIYNDENSDLPDNVIYSILGDDNGNIWMSSNRGITKFDPVKNIFTNYDMDDGLQSREFNGQAEFKSATGEMFFGGINGFNSFFPDSLKNNPYPPRVAITNFKLFNKQVPIGEDSPLRKHISETEEITLSHWQNDISFEFVALHYNKPQKNKYSYILENYDADWNNSSSKRIATYTNLDPGEYVFRVIASNNDGVWNYEGASVKLVITSPWWQTELAYLSYFFFGVGLIYIVNKSQRERVLRAERARTQITEAELRAQTAEAQARAIQAENERKTLELEEARKLQLSMLPGELPDVPGLDIAVHMQTATEVGGDYYDFYKDGGKSLTLVVGDATGHGLKAGTMVSVIKGLFISNAADTDPKTFFEKCTQTIKQLNLGNLYMALSYITINENKMFVSCAGMPPVYVYRKDSKQVEKVTLKGMPLGAFNNFDYKNAAVELNEGDTVLIFSDGLPELFNDRMEMFDYERINRFIEQKGHENVETIKSGLIKEVDNWRNGNTPNDDVTFVVLKVDNKPL